MALFKPHPIWNRTPLPPLCLKESVLHFTRKTGILYKCPQMVKISDNHTFFLPVLPGSSVCWWAADVDRRPSSPRRETDMLWRWWWWRTRLNRWTAAVRIQSTCPGCGGTAWKEKKEAKWLQTTNNTEQMTIHSFLFPLKKSMGSDAQSIRARQES